MNRIAARLMLPALLLALAGCSSFGRNEPAVEPNLFPTNYKKEIIDTIRPMLSDPTNVKDAGITDPTLRPAGKEERYAVCVRANARDPDRKYMGVQYRIAWFFGGNLNQLVDATPEQCGNAAYKPFPELEKLCQAKFCP